MGRLNVLLIYATDIRNAYLEANTQEKVYIIAGPEFVPLGGHTFVMNKALYGLRSSGLRWHEKLTDSLRVMNFIATKAKDDIWMRKNGNLYEYIASYVDDLCIVAREPMNIINESEKSHGYKLKGTGPISYHLDCSYFTESDGNLAYAPRKYITKLIEDFIAMFGHNPKQYTSPWESGDHPELDTSQKLEVNDIIKYQSLISSLQWAISLGCFDSYTAIMSISSFRAFPRQGHLKRSQRIYIYLAKHKDSAIRICISQPNCKNLKLTEYD